MNTPTPTHPSPSSPSSPPLAIDARGLRKAYGRAQALRGVDLRLGWGETLVALGANGSGKTTLVKTLATLAKPDSGELRVAGMSPRRSGASVRRVIGVVTHEPMLYDDLTGGENLRFFAKMFGLDRVDERVARAAERLGVYSRLDDKARALSHGLRRRFSIARALLHDPPLLLMDEPDSGLDRDALALLDAIIADKSNPQRAALITTHDIERGAALCDRVAILAGGRVAREMRGGDASAVRAAYAECAAQSISGAGGAAGA